MYNNMSLELGTGASKEFLEKRQSIPSDGGDNFVSTQSLLSALDLCLKSNYLKFNKKIYKQIKGVGTGIKLAPTYACLGLGKYEKTLFTSDQVLLDKILLWKRFIDDVLMLFSGSREECQDLVDCLNSLMPGIIKFKFEYSMEKIEFLDLEIYIKDGKIKTNLFVKPTNKQLYLDYTSNHPNHCKDSIPYSQALRIIERCTENENKEENLENLKEKLLERNYPTELIERKFESACKKDRKSLIFQKRRQKNKKDGKIRCMLTYNKSNPPIHKWVRAGKKLLEKSEQAKALGEAIQICTKQPKNLQALVGGCKNEPRVAEIPPDAGCVKCGKCKVVCPVLKESKTFTSTATKKTYNIKQKISCGSDWVIYLITCKKCSGQYVGKSKTSFKLRHSNHKCEIKRETGGLGQHYGGRGGCGYENVSVQIIEQVNLKTFDNLAKREQWWQNQLRVFVQNGHKNHCYRKEFT
jgi:hypothetical protein